MELNVGKGKGKADDAGEANDTNTNVAGGDDNLQLLHRPDPPYFWPASRLLVWIDLGLQFPPGNEWYPHSPFESIATPSSVDISLVKIPLTAKELLTFFPRHVNNYHLQDRLTRNGIGGSDQAAMINWQRSLSPPWAVTGQEIRNLIKRAHREFPATNPPVPCTVYTVGDWKHSPANEAIYDMVAHDYGLIDCGYGVNPDMHPRGQDAGPFTKALRSTIEKQRLDVKLSGLDAFLAEEGISRELEEGYSDEKYFAASHDHMTQFKALLRRKAKELGVKWDF